MHICPWLTNVLNDAYLSTANSNFGDNLYSANNHLNKMRFALSFSKAATENEMEKMQQIFELMANDKLGKYGHSKKSTKPNKLKTCVRKQLITVKGEKCIQT